MPLQGVHGTPKIPEMLQLSRGDTNARQNPTMIQTVDIFLILSVLALFFWGIYRRFRLWRYGADEHRTGSMGSRLKTLFVEGIAHRSILRDPYPGILHLFTFFGFLFPLLVIFIVQFMFTLPPLIANLASLFLDVIGFAALISILLLLFRRYAQRPLRLSNTPDDLATLLLILGIVVTGFLL